MSTQDEADPLYENTAEALNFYSTIADQLIRAVNPERVLDVGCAMGFLVEAFWDRGVYCEGIDVSSYALRKVRNDIDRYCTLRSVVDLISDRYDLITCIGLFESLEPDEAMIALKNVCEASDTVFFSSALLNLTTEPARVNGRPTLYWVSAFSRYGFFPDGQYDTSFITPQAMLLRKQAPSTDAYLKLFSNSVRLKTAHLLDSAKVDHAEDLKQQLSIIEQQLRTLQRDHDITLEELLQERDTTARLQRDQATIVTRSTELYKQNLRLQRDLHSVNIVLTQAKTQYVDTLASLPSGETSLRNDRRPYEVVNTKPGLLKNVLTSMIKELERTRRERDSIITSSWWRLARRLQPNLIIYPFEDRAFDRVFRYVWWISTLQLGRKLREKRRILQVLSSSHLFDRNWYYRQYPDIASANKDAVAHYLRRGASEGRNPGPAFDGTRYLEQNPDVLIARINPLVHYLLYGAAEGRDLAVEPIPSTAEINRVVAADTPVTSEEVIVTRTSVSVAEVMEMRFRACEPLRTFLTPASKRRRITVVLDTVDLQFMFGGERTALIMSVLLAKRIHASLRLVTRMQPPDCDSLSELLSANGIEWNQNVEFIYSPPFKGYDVPVSDSDFFLTTSWWTTYCVKKVVDSSRLLYILQEDERILYQHGDERLRCEEIMGSHDLAFIVNSQLLFDHFSNGPEPLLNIRELGIWFEPAFPIKNYFSESRLRYPGAKGKFGLFASPTCSRHFYWRGVEAISAALEEGLMLPEQWDFYFLGTSLSDITLPRNIKPILVENMPWEDYAAFVRQMDVGVCLLDTPHPGYSALELAASGAVVVTNKKGNKLTLTSYSENIICADLDITALKKAIADGIAIVANEELRLAQYSRNRMHRSWQSSFNAVADRLAAYMIHGRAFDVTRG